MRRFPSVVFSVFVLSFGLAGTLRAQEAPDSDSPQGTSTPPGAAPQIFLDKNPRIVAYQLRRLNNTQLLALERHDDQAKYKPVYEAILTRKGVDRKFREEAVAALTKLNHSDPVIEILSAIGNVDAADKGT